jgi:RNA-dependent RNA polymerase
MFGIVDEYGVLESGQVFIQYSSIRENKLKLPDQEEEEEEEGGGEEEKFNRCEVVKGKVVITKNPCHHPGDLRIFDAVYRRELKHLKDVVVFPQKGNRPHSNEISGSDLDG